MATTFALPTSASAASKEKASSGSGQLAAAALGERVRILGIAQDDEHAAWLRAVGMHENAEVTVLRKAPFGGPIHLRSADGGEFAIHRDLARCIQVVSVDAGSAA